MHRFFYAFIVIFSCLLFSSRSVANTCPSVKDIQQHALSGWKWYDSDDDKPLVAKQQALFEKRAAQFALAEWAAAGQGNGTIHCYYTDKNGSHLDVYLAKKRLALNDTHHYWYQVSGYMHCAAGADRCQFNDRMAKQPVLAGR